MSMSIRSQILIYVALLALAGIFLAIQRVTHIDFMLHVAAIPLEILAAVFLVDRILENRLNKDRRRQLMHIKSCIFRLEMRDLFVVNLAALKSPRITMPALREATLHELKKLRADAETVEYRSPEDMEPVIMEYVKSQDVWRNFMDIAREYHFEEIFQDMLYIMHFIGDVKTIKEHYPDDPFIHHVAGNERLMDKVMKVLGDGIRKFLDYVIELKEKQPELFNQIISDYELSLQLRG